MISASIQMCSKSLFWKQGWCSKYHSCIICWSCEHFSYISNKVSNKVGLSLFYFWIVLSYLFKVKAIWKMSSLSTHVRTSLPVCFWGVPEETVTKNAVTAPENQQSSTAEVSICIYDELICMSVKMIYYFTNMTSCFISDNLL